MSQRKEQVVDNEFTLDVVQAAEIKYAVVRNGGTNADLKALSSGDMFARILPILRGYGKVVMEFLQLLGEAAFHGTTNFVAGDNFLVNTKADVKVRISWLADNFKVWMLGKTEKKVVSSTLVYGKLTKNAKDEVIISFLGGEAKAETSLAEVFHLMSLQPNDEAGALLTNGWANIFYVKDVNDVLRAVGVHWYGDGWHVHTYPTDSPFGWNEGGQVFFRKAF